MYTDSVWNTLAIGTPSCSALVRSISAQICGVRVLNSVKADLLRGLYRLRPAPGGVAQVRLLGSGAILREVEPEDLLKFGLIPEFIGRLPVVATLEDLDRAALIQILTRPRNAIIKQYQKLFDFEGVRLKFSDDALDAVAQLAMERKVGARGLRMILEDLMLDLMYNLPSNRKIRDFLVTKEMVMTQNINLALLEKSA